MVPKFTETMKSPSPYYNDAYGGYRPIEEYGIIGDTMSAALVSKTGSIDWCCLPYFDSDAIFCRLLDQEKGGFCQIYPTAFTNVHRHYLSNTNILKTTFETEQGPIDLLDLFGVSSNNGNNRHKTEIIRILRCSNDGSQVNVICYPTFHFAQKSYNYKEISNGFLYQLSHDAFFAINCSVPLVASEKGFRTSVSLKEREDLFLTLTYYHGYCNEKEIGGDFSVNSVEGKLTYAEKYWRNWISKSDYHGFAADLVHRSALTLKLLTFKKTGALVAAPTTSLPEALCGERNWDYRYTWLRDASLTLYCLQSLGFHEESIAFFNWLENLCLCGHKDLSIMYTIWGRQVPNETTLEHLEGYKGSSPVRIGNDAAKQHQADAYGHILDAIWYCYTSMPRKINKELVSLIILMAERTVKRWRKPGNGIWEFRDKLHHFTYSKAMCWVALDRAIKLAPLFEGEEYIERWAPVRDEIKDYVLNECYNHDLEAFVQTPHSSELDASVLTFPLLGIGDVNDPRMLSTIEKVRNRLAKDQLIYRYTVDDKLEGQEGVFVLCSFWMVENLAMTGHLQEACELFHKIAGYSNDLGLLSEEIMPDSGEQLGNFPQGFSHLGLIRAALRINHYLGGVKA